MDRQLSKTLFMEMSPGDVRRIIHEFDKEGNECSVGKDPCLNIKRTSSGLQYYCHRCEEGGFMKMDGLSPMETLEVIKGMKKRGKEELTLNAEVANLKLPDDVVPVTIDDGETWNSKAVPWTAIHWLWAAGFMIPKDIDFELHWSKDYNRLIFPIRDKEGFLLGWVGRDVDKSGPKYMTRKQTTKKDRLLYICEGSTEVVFVEDIISALKVHKASGYTTVALLTTALSFTLAKMFRGRELHLWLDGDMMTKSVRKVTRLASFGYRICSIRTLHDPKEYSTDEIREHLTITIKEDEDGKA
jgi:hypothetical protein